MKTNLANLAKQETGIIFVSILLGLILVPWAKPLFAQNVASQQQAASVLAVENLAVQDGTSQEPFVTNRRTPFAMCSCSSAIRGYGRMSSVPAKTTPVKPFIQWYPGR